MLSEPHRLSSSTDFREVVRRGRRASRPLLTVHLLMGDARPGSAGAGEAPVLAGLVVGKAVGGSVVRSRAARRLRHLLRDRIEALPAGSRVVVRAAPAAGAAPSRALAADLDAALSSACPERSRR